MSNQGQQRIHESALAKCRLLAMERMEEQIEQLFNDAPEAFFQFAEKAGTDTARSGLLGASHTVTKNRREIRDAFATRFNQAFESIGRQDPSRAQFAADAGDESEMRLLDLGEMEEQIAVKKLINRTQNENFSELYALRQRFSLINGGNLLREDQVPAGPAHLVVTFRDAIKPLGMEFKFKVMLYALFDKYVLKNAWELYQALNESLKADGVLPNLVHITKPQGAAAGTPPQAKPPQSQAQAAKKEKNKTLGDELFGSILSLMAEKRSRGDGMVAGSIGLDGQVYEPVPRETLVQTISNIQTSQPSPFADAFVSRQAAADFMDDAQFLEKAKSLLVGEREQLFQEIKPQQMTSADHDVIEIVGFMFEYMLNEEALPNLAKALMSRLHTPYLKAAMLDNSMLDNSEHHGWQLLNLMVESGCSYVDERDPNWGIFPALRKVVDRIFAEFKDNIELFSDLLEQLRISVNEQKRKNTALEQRAKDSAVGIEKFQTAKKRAGEEISARLNKEPMVLPEVANFLKSAWVDHLVIIYLRDTQGDKGKPWAQTLKVAEDLIALCNPVGQAMVPGVLEEKLQKLHKDLAFGLDTMGGGNPPEEWPPLAELLTSSQRLMQAQAMLRAERHAKKLTPPSPGAALPGGEARQETAPRSRVISAEEHKLLDRIRSLGYGTWFEFKRDENLPKRRLKLSWYSSLTDNCLLVDRAGIKQEIRSASSLAEDVLAGRAKIVSSEETPFVSRALRSIASMLGKAVGKGNGAKESRE